MQSADLSVAETDDDDPAPGLLRGLTSADGIIKIVTSYIHNEKLI